MNTNCQKGTHEKVVFDQFSKDLAFSRSVPGDCYCLNCKQPIAAWWNEGKPEAIQPINQSTATGAQLTD